MLFWGFIQADYFKIANEDLYMGIEEGKLKLVEKEYATNFERRQISSVKKYLTALVNSDGNMVSFDYSGNSKLSPYSESNYDYAFLILLDTNANFVLVSGTNKCLYSSEKEIKRGDCGNPQYVKYWQITKRSDSHDLQRQEIIKVGNKSDNFNPIDPLAVNGDVTAVKDNDKEKVLLPYHERLANVPNVPLPDPKNAQRILVKFNIF